VQLLSRNNPPTGVNSPRAPPCYFFHRRPLQGPDLHLQKATFIKRLTQKASPHAVRGARAHTNIFKLMTYIHSVIWIIKPTKLMYKPFITPDWKGIWNLTLILQIITIESNLLWTSLWSIWPNIHLYPHSNFHWQMLWNSQKRLQPSVTLQNDLQGMWDTLHIVQDCKIVTPMPCLIIYLKSFD